MPATNTETPIYPTNVNDPSLTVNNTLSPSGVDENIVSSTTASYAIIPGSTTIPMASTTGLTSASGQTLVLNDGLNIVFYTITGTVTTNTSVVATPTVNFENSAIGLTQSINTTATTASLTTAVGSNVLAVASTTGFAVGQIIFATDGTYFDHFIVTAVDSVAKTITATLVVETGDTSATGTIASGAVVTNGYMAKSANVVLVSYATYQTRAYTVKNLNAVLPSGEPTGYGVSGTVTTATTTTTANIGSVTIHVVNSLGYVVGQTLYLTDGSNTCSYTITAVPSTTTITATALAGAVGSTIGSAAVVTNTTVLPQTSTLSDFATAITSLGIVITGTLATINAIAAETNPGGNNVATIAQQKQSYIAQMHSGKLNLYKRKAIKLFTDLNWLNADMVGYNTTGIPAGAHDPTSQHRGF